MKCYTLFVVLCTNSYKWCIYGTNIGYMKWLMHVNNIVTIWYFLNMWLLQNLITKLDHLFLWPLIFLFCMLQKHVQSQYQSMWQKHTWITTWYQIAYTNCQQCGGHFQSMINACNFCLVQVFHWLPLVLPDKSKVKEPFGTFKKLDMTFEVYFDSFDVTNMAWIIV